MATYLGPVPDRVYVGIGTSGDTGVPDDSWRRGDTDVPANLHLHDWHSYSLPEIKSPPVETRCSYCNLRALPEDRFCEGCGAPV